MNYIFVVLDLLVFTLLYLATSDLLLPVIAFLVYQFVTDTVMKLLCVYPPLRLVN